MARLTEGAGDAFRNRHPRIKFVVVPLDAPEKVCAPELAFAGFITNRFEWDGHFHGVALRVDHALRFHHDIDAEVFAAALGKRRIALNAERIEKSFKRLAL